VGTNLVGIVKGGRISKSLRTPALYRQNQQRFPGETAKLVWLEF